MQFNKEYSDFKHLFMKMMEQFESMQDEHLGRVTVPRHLIVLTPPDASPVHSAPYRPSPKQRELERQEVDVLREAGNAEPAMTEWALFIVFVQIKDESLRFCVEYRRLNVVTERASYPNQKMNKSTDSLGKAQIFPALDANLRY